MIKPIKKIKDVFVSTEAQKTELKKAYPPMKDWIFNRLGEKSTWRGIFTVLTIAGLSLGPDVKEAVIGTGVSLIGLLEVIFKEPQSKDSNG